MVWKVVNISNPGTSTQYGADDTDKINKLFSGFDVDDVDINSDFAFRDGKLQLFDSTHTNKYTITTSAISENRTLNVPLITGTDTFTVNSLAQTLSNKTLDSSCNVSAAISGGTIVKTDQANIFGDFDQSFQDNRVRIYNPAGTFRYTIIGAAILGNRDLSLPLLTGNDTVVAQSHTQTLTNKTIDVADNTLALRAYDTIIFKKSTTYYAKKYDGTIISSGSVPETVIQAALDLAGDIYIASGTYTMSGGFTGLNFLPETSPLYRHTNLIMSVEAQIIVPNGYTGYVFGMIDVGTSHSIYGGNISEAGTVARDWTAIYIKSTATRGCWFITLDHLQFNNPGVGIKLETTHADGFINSNTFKDIQINSPEKGIQFITVTGGIISSNTFEDIKIQCASGVTTYGVQDVQEGDSNYFSNLQIWDIDSTATEMNIKPTASGTVIAGGKSTGQSGAFIDQGNQTLKLDSYESRTSGLFTTPDIRKWGTWAGHHATSGDGLLAGRITEVVVGTGAATQLSGSNGIYREYTTGSTTNSIMGIYMPVKLLTRVHNAYLKAMIEFEHTTNMRVFVGLINSNAAPTSTADPLNALEGIGLWLDTAVSSNWKLMHNDNVGASTVDNPWSLAVATSTLYPVEMFAMDDSKFRFIFNGVATDVSTNIPSSGTDLGFRIYVENTTGSARIIRAHYLIIRNDR